MKATPQTFLRFIAGAAVAAAVLFLVWYFSSIVVYPRFGRAGRHGQSAREVSFGASLQRLAGSPLAGRAGDPRGDLGRPGCTLCSLFVPLVFNKINQFAHVDFAAVVGTSASRSPGCSTICRRFLPAREHFLALRRTTAAGSIIDINSLNTIFSSVINLVLSSVIAIFLRFVHHLLLPQGGGPVLRDGHLRFPGTLSRQHHPCAGFGDGPAGALFLRVSFRKACCPRSP